MPRILSYTPPWLSRPSPGFEAFRSSELESQTPPANGSTRQEARTGPKRTVARRGTEIFVVINNQIRWTDLRTLKEHWAEFRRRSSKRKEKGKRKNKEDGARSGDLHEDGEDPPLDSYKVGEATSPDF